MLILLDFNLCYCVLLMSKLTPSFPFHYLVFKHFPTKFFLIRMTFQSNLIFGKIFLASTILCNIIHLEDIEDISQGQTFFPKTWNYFYLKNISKFPWSVIFCYNRKLFICSIFLCCVFNSKTLIE